MTPNTILQRRAARHPPTARACRTGVRYGSQCWRHQSGGAGKATSFFKECQQVGVELVLVSVRDAVGCPRVDL